MKRIFLAVLASLSFLFACAQNDNPWKGKKCAVVLTYDDALSVQLDNAIPTLDSLGLKATFYLSGYSTGCTQRLADWKKAALHGHELGNHTLFHPCTGKLPGREWVSPDYDLGNYTFRRFLDETRMTNVLLEAIDGKKKRTFAYTCGDMKIGDSSFVNDLKKDFIAARGVRSQLNRIDKVDLYNVDCYAVNNTSAEEMIGWVKKAMETRSLLVILFHGVGGGHSINVSLSAHSQLLHYLKQNEKDIWITPMLDAAEYIRDGE